jgi:hypothetical protein
MNICTVEQKVSFFRFVVRRHCLKMSVVLNVLYIQVLSGLNIFIHPLNMLFPLK